MIAKRRRIRVALVGVGNCASSLVQGVEFYRDSAPDELVPGLMHVELGGYHVRDIEFCAAFDVAKGKVGLDLAAAIHAEPNNTFRFAEVPPAGVPVLRGPTLDGIGRYLRDLVRESSEKSVDVVQALRDSRAEVLVCYLPVGSEKAVRAYARAALAAGCAFVNCVPVFLASDATWRQRFERAGLPLIGDDVKSQVGATITHRVLANLFRERGVRLDRTYQLNFGGNADFRNMLERERLHSKKLSKTRAVTSQLPYELAEGNAHVSPSDYVPFLADQKVCYIRMEGTTFGNVPLRCELKLEVWDSPNSAGVVVDAIRCARLALDRGIGGALSAPSSWFMKSPPVQLTDDEARLAVEAFVREATEPAENGNGGAPADARGGAPASRAAPPEPARTRVKRRSRSSEGLRV